MIIGAVNPVDMRGDLHTLRKTCLYGSKVMAVGSIFIALVLACLLAIGALSALTDDPSATMAEVLGDSVDDAWEYAEVLAVFLLAEFTVLTTYWVMSSISGNESPFTVENTGRITLLSKVYVVAAFILAVFEYGGSRSVASTAFLFFGCILLAAVLFMFGLMVRYGSVLQDQSDRTL